MNQIDQQTEIRPAPKPLPRHLIDLNNPRPRRANPGMSVTQVQRWVSSVLVVTLMEHFAAGLILGAVFSARSNISARIGLNVLAALVSITAIVAARAIHGRKPLSAWPALGLLVGALGYYVTFRL